MTDISAISFFRQGSLADDSGIDFEHEEIDTGGTKRPTKIHLHAVDPNSGDRMGTLTYHVPRRKADKILVEHLGTEEAHQGKGVASALMDEMQRRHPATPIDHGDRTDAGKGWWNKYTDGKTVRRGRTMASADGNEWRTGTADAVLHGEPIRRQATLRRATAAVEEGDDVPSRLLNPHGHHIKAKVGNLRNVEMVPRNEIARYASQDTDPEHAKAVGHHIATTGEMEPLLLHYHPASGEAYLGEGNHRLRASYPLQMDHLPVRVQRNNYGLPGPGVKVPQDHPALAAGKHIPHDIKPSDIGLTTVDKPTMSEWDKNSELARYRLLHPREAAAVPGPESYARQDGEDEYAHRDRVNRGLSLGHLATEEAEGTGGYQYVHGGWKPLPRELYHTTTDLPGVQANGLKAGHELGQKKGHGLGGTPQYLSLTDSAEHAHTMLNALHEYHSILNGKTTFADLHRAAEAGGGAQKPYGKAFMDQFGKDPARISSLMRSKHFEQGPFSDEEAREKGLVPHATHHERLPGAEHGTNWERDRTEDEQIEHGHTIHMAFSSVRDWVGGGPKHIMFTSNNRKAFAAKDPSHFGIVRVRPQPGAQGFENRGEHEWRTATGDAVQVHGEPIRRQASAVKPCPCCGGTGEHDTGFECYHCDGGRTVPTDSPDDAACDGRLPDGGHGKTATYTENPLPAEVRSWKNTEWDVPHQVDQPIHRGLTIPLSPEDHALVHDPQVSPGKRAAHIVKLVSQNGNLGRHWTLDPDVASHYSTSAVGEMKDHPHVLAVSLHAHPPAAEHVEHDPVELGRMQVKAHSVEKEIPLKDNVPVRMYGVSWHNPRDHTQSGRYIATAQAKGITRNASADTPVPDNDQPYEHEHDWLPRDHFFAPGEKGLDPRLFDENERMHPEVRQYLLSLLNSFWAPKYGDSWQTWARVYLAGSEASHWYGNNDLDILIGIDHEALHHHVDHFTGEPDNAIDEKITDELRHGLNDDARMLPGPDGKDTGPFENTWFVNPGSYDIREIKPYAAYDITRDEWAVKPVEVPDDFGPEKLPESTWDVFDALQKLIKAVAELPEGVREREGAALYDYLHADRHSAFGPEGSGLYDLANATWKALDKAPGKPLQQLIDWKHAHDGAATDQETAA
jgi:GNAT superfamily N-acetyltransferase